MSTIAEALSKKKSQNPQFDYLWRAELPSIDVQVDSSGGDALQKYQSKTQNPDQSPAVSAQEISHRIYEITPPHISFDTRKSIHGVSYRYAVDHHDIGTLSMLIDEMEDGMTLAYINQWMALMGNADGSRNPPAMYKKNIRFIKVSKAQTDIHYSEYIGYFPTEIQAVQHSYDGSGVVQYSVTFAGDDVRHTRVSPEQGIAAAEQEILTANYRSPNKSSSAQRTKEEQTIANNNPYRTAIDMAARYFGF